MDARDRRRYLPAVGRLLEEPLLGGLIALYGRDTVRVQARLEVAALRTRLQAGAAAEHDVERQAAALAERVATALTARLGSGLVRVINATGILVHTNLGRTPLPRPVVDELLPILSGHCDLELDLASGQRSERNRRVGALLEALTGAAAGLVVNNNAGALMLVLATLARGRQVVVSRGELVEIGGSFRIPEILAAAGAELVEVGTTNRTHLADYERAIGPDTALLLKVHPSNYRIAGFSAAVPAAALVELVRRLDPEAPLPVVVDEGAGLLRPSLRPQLRDHASMETLIAAGCDLVCGSGDKLLGGPQAGIIVGRQRWVERCRRHPIYRALRPDRFTFAALEAVLRRHLAGAAPPVETLWLEAETHRPRLLRVAAQLEGAVVPAQAFVGGGAAPDAPIPGEAVAVPGGEELHRKLRTGTPPVLSYVRHGRLILDLRTVAQEDDAALIAAVQAARSGTETQES